MYNYIVILFLFITLFFINIKSINIDLINNNNYNYNNNNNNNLNNNNNNLLKRNYRNIPNIWTAILERSSHMQQATASTTTTTYSTPILNYNNNNNNNNNNMEEILKIQQQQKIRHNNHHRYNTRGHHNNNNQQQQQQVHQQQLQDQQHNNHNHHQDNNQNINDNNDNNNNNTDKQYICETCQQVHKIKMTENELTELRIEFVKNQILKKLRLKVRPTISYNYLPRPVAEGATILNNINNLNNNNNNDNTDDNNNDDDIDDNLNRHFDDYYAKTTQKIIFPKEDNEQCKNLADIDKSKCFSFQIPNDIEMIDVNYAELWIYKYSDILDAHNQTYVISEIIHWDKQKSFTKLKPISIHDTDINEGWLKIDITWSIKNWFQYNELKHIINISCRTCAMEFTYNPLINNNNNNSDNSDNIEHNFMPFIVIDTNNQRKIKRKRRNVNCSTGITECCREKLYISFADIGWNDWILYPAGYHAYFCRGSCTSAATVTLSGSYYNSVLRKVMYLRNSGGQKNLELIPCCTATQFSSLQLFYMDSNHTATQKTLPNMVVEGCGCM